MHRAGVFVWALVSAGLMMVGAFGPWVTVLGLISANGWDVQKKEAGILLVLALLGAVAVFTRRTSPTSGSVATFTGLGGLVLSVWEHHRITSALASASSQGSSFIHFDVGAVVHVGWGLDLALLASASLMLAGIASFFVAEATHGEAAAERTAATYEPSVPAGWYRDPNDEALLRYWNGFGWTTQTAKPAS